MAETITYLSLDTDHVKISIAPLKDTLDVRDPNSLVLIIGKDDVLIIEANVLGLVKIPIKQYVIVRKEEK